MNRQPKQQDIVDALTRSRGIISGAALTLGVSRTWLTRRIAKSEVLTELVAELRETLIDRAEGVLLTMLASDDPKIKLQAATLILRSLGRQRGWTEQHDVRDVTDTTPLSAEERDRRAMAILDRARARRIAEAGGDPASDSR